MYAQREKVKEKKNSKSSSEESLQHYVEKCPPAVQSGGVYYQKLEDRYYYCVASGEGLYHILKKLKIDIQTFLAMANYEAYDPETGEIIDKNGQKRYLQAHEAIALDNEVVSLLNLSEVEHFEGTNKIIQSQDTAAFSFEFTGVVTNTFGMSPTKDKINPLSSEFENIEREGQEILKLSIEEQGQKIAEIAAHNSSLVEWVYDKTSFSKEDDLSRSVMAKISIQDLHACKKETLKLFYDSLNSIIPFAVSAHERDRMKIISTLIGERKEKEEKRKDNSYDIQLLAKDIKQVVKLAAKGDRSKVDWLSDTLILLSDDAMSFELLKASYAGDFYHDMHRLEMLSEVRSSASYVYKSQESNSSALHGELLMIENDFYYQIKKNDSVHLILNKLGLSETELLQKNNWLKILENGKLVEEISEGQNKERWLQEGERIKIPKGIKIQKLQGYWVSEDGGAKFSRRNISTKKTELISQEDINLLAEEIKPLMTKGILKHLDKLQTMFRALEGKEVYAHKFKIAYHRKHGITFSKELKIVVQEAVRLKLIEENKFDAKDSLANLSVFSRQVNEYEQHILGLMIDENISPLEQMQAYNAENKVEDFHDKNAPIKSEKVRLWENISLERLISQAQEVLAPCLKSPYPKADETDTFPLYHSIASLRKDEKNIQAFLENYGGKTLFLQDLKKAKITKVIRESSYSSTGNFSSSYAKEVEKALFTEEQISEIEKALEPKTLGKHKIEDHRNQEFELLSDESGPNFEQFQQGEFIIHQQDNYSRNYYVLKKGDSLWSLAQKYGMSFSQLLELNKEQWKSINKDGTINDIRGNRASLIQGKGIRVSRSAIMMAPYYYYLQDSAAYKLSPKEIQYYEGTYRIDEKTFDPDVFEKIVSKVLGGEHGLSKDSAKLSFKVYIRGEIVLVFSLEAGLKAELESSVGDDRKFEVKKSLKLYLKEGVDLGIFKAEAEQKLWGIGGTDVYESVKHFAVDMNHKIYLMYLENASISSDMISYWDDEENRDLLMKGHEVLSKAPAKNIGPKNKQFTYVNHSYSTEEGQDFVGDREDKSKSRTKRSADFYEENDSEAQLISGVLYDSSLLSVEYSKVKLDSNSDNDGAYYTTTLKLSKNSINKVVAEAGKSLEDVKDGSFWSEQAKGFINDKGYLDFMRALSQPIRNKNGGRDLRKDMVKIRNQNKGKTAPITILGKKMRASSESDLDIGVEIVVHYVEDGGLKLQYINVNGFGSFNFGVSAQASYAKIATIKAGFEVDMAVEQMLSETPGTDTLTYISTIYNSLAYRSDKMDEREEREKITAEAQDLRVEKWEKYLNDNQEASKQEKEKQLNALKNAEFKHIQDHYWGDYAAKESPAWEAYKGKHKDSLNEMARKFFTPIFEAEDKSTWEGIKLMTVDEAFMKKYGRYLTPQDMMDAMLMKQKDLIKINYSHLEKFTLIHLYKKHQKYAFDYYKYNNGNDKK